MIPDGCGYGPGAGAGGAECGVVGGGLAGGLGLPGGSVVILPGAPVVLRFCVGLVFGVAVGVGDCVGYLAVAGGFGRRGEGGGDLGVDRGGCRGEGEGRGRREV